MDTPILRAEHEEFRRAMEVENKRLEDENNRQNHRIEVLEKSTEQIQILTSSVEEVTVHYVHNCKCGKYGEGNGAAE